MMGFGWILILLVLVLVGAGALFPLSRASPPTQPDASPLDIAEQRYAKGEIGKDEFENIKRSLA